MRLSRLMCVSIFCSMLCHAQLLSPALPTLALVRSKYDAPFERNLKSFDCAIEFSWKDHFKETTRVGDEGTDQELETIFQPIRHRVVVTKDKVSVASNLTEQASHQLPHGGMADGLLEHAVQKSLYNWLASATNAMLPAQGTAVSVVNKPSGYQLAYKIQGADIEMDLGMDLRMQRAGLKPPAKDHFDVSFASGPQGFLLSTWTVDEDGNPDPGHRLVFTYTYQVVDGVQVPEFVAVIRESHHEVWHYRLTGCSIKTNA